MLTKGEYAAIHLLSAQVQRDGLWAVYKEGTYTEVWDLVYKVLGEEGDKPAFAVPDND
jgi:hypothetical protein